ncbi:MAG: plasma-membrane proton-efflux P-type ATPase [Thermoprotei archaeon]
MQKDEYESMTAGEALSQLGVDPGLGLTESEVEKRVKEFGYNEIPEKEESALIVFAKKFWGLTAWMLEVTLVLTAIIGDRAEAFIIAGLLVVNAIIGFIHEQKASRAVEFLKQRLQIMSRVLREGSWKVIAAREIVQGDIIRIRAGDVVPADVKLITQGEAEVDQSALTGESMPVTKKAGDVLYSGSIIRRGEGTAVVIRTGLKTYFGKTVQLVGVARPKLHMEEIVSNVVALLLVLVGLLSAVMLALTYLLTGNAYFLISYVVPLVLTLLVFAVPVALPAMFTVTMAVGATEMAKKGVLITKLSAVEDAASMTTLNADKTGTLTYNRLTLARVVPLEGHDEEEVIVYGALASQEANQDPIDLAFINAARGRKLDVSNFKIKEFKPFDPSTRRTEALVESPTGTFWVAKGAVRTIAEQLRSDPDLAKKAEDLMSKYAVAGYRTLAVAKREENSWDVVGLAALYDVPREDTPTLIKDIKGLGVKFKMLTGDAKPIAAEVARNVGLDGNVTTGDELRELARDNPESAADLADRSDVFAEIYPEDKYFIVKSLQMRKEVVGMTGDGINDAPALRQAEAGIAVSNATDVAKAASSVVLTVEGLSGIADLIKVGRSTYQRIVTWILNKVVKTFEIAVFVVLAFLFSALVFHRPLYVVSSLDVILFLFLIDFVTISLSTDNAKGSPRPERWDVPMMIKLGAGLGAFTVSEMFGLLCFGEYYFRIADAHELHTYFFTAIMFMGILTPFIVRERRSFWSSKPGKWLLIASLADMAMVSLIALTGLPTPWGRLLTPISGAEYALVLAYCAVASFLVNDLAKKGLARLGISRRRFCELALSRSLNFLLQRPCVSLHRSAVSRRRKPSFSHARKPVKAFIRGPIRAAPALPL